MCAFNDMINNWVALVVGVTALAFGIKMIWDQPAPPDGPENMKRAMAFLVAAGGFWFAFLAEFGEARLASQTRGFSGDFAGAAGSCPPSAGFPFVMTAIAGILTLAFLFYLGRSIQPQEK